MTEPTVEFTGDFSEPTATAVPWAEVDEVLTKSEMFWLSTVRADGRPHVTPLPAIWLGGALHFCVGPQEQKAVNLRANPHCVLTTGTNQLRSGLDVITEGAAALVTTKDTLVELAALWKSKLDWDFEVRDGGFKNSAGGDALVYGVAPVKVLSFGKSPYSQTRYRFS
jgi:X-X-X-Leu-X-X-Gly heptad repeat protein